MLESSPEVGAFHCDTLSSSRGQNARFSPQPGYIVLAPWLGQPSRMPNELPIASGARTFTVACRLFPSGFAGVRYRVVTVPGPPFSPDPVICVRSSRGDSQHHAVFPALFSRRSKNMKILYSALNLARKMVFSFAVTSTPAAM